ncbi:MAG: hypothetical protein NVS3B25_09870 [Hymenobacter sp.]
MADSPDPLSTGAGIGGAVGSGVGDLIGYFLSQGDRDKARQLIDQSTGMYQHLDPRIQAQQAQTMLAGPSAYNKLQMDPADRGNQLQALGALKNIYSQGGMDAQARADIAQATAGADQNAQALNNNIQNQMAQRGLDSSGASFAMQRANAQNAANQASQNSLQAQAAGEMRAQNALAAYGQQANQLRGADYQQASDQAGANDAINRFNSAMGTQNNQYNATNRQNAQQNTFDNGYQQARGVGGNAGAYQGFADNTMRTSEGAGKAVGGAVGMAAMASDARLKTNIQRHAHEVIPGVPLATFEYKSHPGKTYAGVIAQDLEKVAPEHVSHDADGVKYVSAQFGPQEVKLHGGEKK